MGYSMHRKVLLVEDETIVRLIGSDALSDAGYEVVEAGSADEAIRILEAIGEVQVLFTDIRMPGSMNGLELAKLVHDRWPTIKILLTSGDTFPPKDVIPDDGQFLPKPYKIETLAQKVDDLLSR
ncbi:response regulator [Sphingomonas nostoxanthinifaciens]|uniref:response regulator n=1 Tax=Sphingomonas nostoxanthinifaciens TaxID=2872652 RepID=UPI001CC21C33|nr:response regulator [Sphingomonas nostoxanthinifaciens]UAK25250.1 response regulator [Sphingomonas nostoxanthinifaciens]